MNIVSLFGNPFTSSSLSSRKSSEEDEDPVLPIVNGATKENILHLTKREREGRICHFDHVVFVESCHAI